MAYMRRQYVYDDAVMMLLTYVYNDYADADVGWHIRDDNMCVMAR